MDNNVRRSDDARENNIGHDSEKAFKRRVLRIWKIAVIATAIFTLGYNSHNLFVALLKRYSLQQ